METNILVAIKNLLNDPVTNITHYSQSGNRMNNMGESLESYVKDIFCNSLNEKDLKKKNEIYSEYFSYIGNQNNPPDVIIRNGDAVEIKKIESLRAGIALNSSYPKDKLFVDSPMITNACKTCEDWQEKDLIYIIGSVKEGKLKALWFVYGDCYAAESEIYERVKTKISKGINELSDVEFSDTNELGRVNKVDPLGITYLRIRGMWGIENPVKVFSDVISDVKETEFSVNAIMLAEKYNSFPEQDRKNIEQLINNNFSIKNIKIKSPNNPAKLLNAKLFNYFR